MEYLLTRNFKYLGMAHNLSTDSILTFYDLNDEELECVSIQQQFMDLQCCEGKKPNKGKRNVSIWPLFFFAGKAKKFD